MGYPGQQFAQGDLNRSDLKSFTSTVDLASKSAKTEYVRVQGNQPLRGGGAGFPIQGEQRFQELVNDNIGWNLNAQGEPTRTAEKNSTSDRCSNTRRWSNLRQPRVVGRKTGVI
jgi:hypothetical protein